MTLASLCRLWWKNRQAARTLGRDAAGTPEPVHFETLERRLLLSADGLDATLVLGASAAQLVDNGNAG